MLLVGWGVGARLLADLRGDRARLAREQIKEGRGGGGVLILHPRIRILSPPSFFMAILFCYMPFGDPSPPAFWTSYEAAPGGGGKWPRKGSQIGLLDVTRRL